MSKANKLKQLLASNAVHIRPTALISSPTQQPARRSWWKRHRRMALHRGGVAS